MYVFLHNFDTSSFHLKTIQFEIPLDVKINIPKLFECYMIKNQTIYLFI